MTVFVERIFTKVTKLTSLGWALTRMTGVLIKKVNFGDRHAHRENTLWKWSQIGVVFQQEHQNLPGNHQNTRQEAWDQASLTTCRRKQPCWHLDVGLQVSKIVRSYILLLKLPSLWYLFFFYSNSRELIQWHKHSCVSFQMSTNLHFWYNCWFLR